MHHYKCKSYKISNLAAGQLHPVSCLQHVRPDLPVDLRLVLLHSHPHFIRLMFHHHRLLPPPFLLLYWQ